MSDNLKLVNFIIKELIKNNSHKLEFIASVDFAYYLNSEPKQNFAQLAKRAAMVQWNTILITSKVTSTDDTHFYQDLGNLALSQNFKKMCYYPTQNEQNILRD